METTGGSPPISVDQLAEQIARHFHSTYERLGPSYGWESQESARDKDFDELPESNRRLMVATVKALLESGVIEPGSGVLEPLHPAAHDAG